MTFYSGWVKKIYYVFMYRHNIKEKNLYSYYVYALVYINYICKWNRDYSSFSLLTIQIWNKSMILF